MGAKFNLKKENVFISLNSALFIKTQTPLDGFVVDLLQTCMLQPIITCHITTCTNYVMLRRRFFVYNGDRN